MTKLLSVAAICLFSISAFAHDSIATPSPEQIKERIQNARLEMAGRMADELANLPEDIQVRCREARDRADRLGREIQALRADSLSPEEMQARIKELIAVKKAQADERIKVALEKIEAYKTEHKAEIDAAHAEIKARIDQKKAELETKRAEIEAKIAAKKAEIEAALAEKTTD